MTDYFLILPNQLFNIKYIDKKYYIILWECPHYFIDYNYNKKKLLLHRSSMISYYNLLLNKGYKVEYYNFKAHLDNEKSYTLYNPLNNIDILKLPSNITIIESPNILLTEKLMNEYHNKTDKFFFNAFYMWLKKKLNIIPDIKSQDKFNRKRQKNYKNIKQPYSKQYNSNYIKESKEYININFSDNPGNIDNFIFPITHTAAKKWLKHFIKYKLKYFGPYQDFINKNDNHMYHSLLSTLINIGLLNPIDIIENLQKLSKDKIPLNSYEGFIRQLFWREYQYYCYKYFTFDSNYFDNKKKLSNDWYNGTTGILPVDDAIIEAFNTGYLHHIKRLMVIGNYMNISEINPKEGFRWFMEFSCDSYEWVMHQNVYEMVFFISGGKTMRRPYISSSNYILKMSNYSKGKWCDKWNKKYKKFISKNKNKLIKYRYYIRI